MTKWLCFQLLKQGFIAGVQLVGFQNHANLQGFKRQLAEAWLLNTVRFRERDGCMSKTCIRVASQVCPPDPAHAYLSAQSLPSGPSVSMSSLIHVPNTSWQSFFCLKPAVWQSAVLVKSFHVCVLCVCAVWLGSSSSTRFVPPWRWCPRARLCATTGAHPCAGSSTKSSPTQGLIWCYCHTLTPFAEFGDGITEYLGVPFWFTKEVVAKRTKGTTALNTSLQTGEIAVDIHTERAVLALSSKHLKDVRSHFTVS